MIFINPDILFVRKTYDSLYALRFSFLHLLRQPIEAIVPKISIIVPTLNEIGCIKKLVDRLRETTVPVEVIIADGGSHDGTCEALKALGVKCVPVNEKSRPQQLNAGAKEASADVLYFVHADTLPPTDYAQQILRAVQGGAKMGSFRFRFDTNAGALRLNSYCTRFPFIMFRGGDQSLFITRQLFAQIGGYDSGHIVMEDYDIIRRARKVAPFHILKDDVIVSARKYTENSYFRVNCANFAVFSLYYFGVKPAKLLQLYKRLIKHPKA